MALSRALAALLAAIEGFLSTLAMRVRRPALTARSNPSPCPVNQVRGEPIKAFPYIWYYRTEVHNASKVPMRIIAFTSYSRSDGRWIEWPNVMKRALKTSDFVNWYTEGDPAPDGWIAPGHTAVCDPYWTGLVRLPTAKQTHKLVYTAEDHRGKKYSCEAVIELLP